MKLSFLDAALRRIPIVGRAFRAFDSVVQNVGRMATVSAVLANVAGQHAQSIAELEARYDALVRVVRGPAANLDAIARRAREPDQPN